MQQHVLIMASAGSGKTYQLTHCYLRILHTALRAGCDEEAPRILASTFTRAAAGEIIDKILQALTEAVLDREERNKLGAALGARLSEEDCARLLGCLVQHLHHLRICTLDAFLVRAAVAFGPELGLPASFRVVDDAEDRRLREEAIERVLEQHLDEPAEREKMLDLLIGLRNGRFPREVLSVLVDEFSDTHSTFLAAPPEAWDALAVGPASVKAEELLAELRKYGSGPVARAAWPAWLADYVIPKLEEQDWLGITKLQPMKRLIKGEPVVLRSTPAPPAVQSLLVKLLALIRWTYLSTLRTRNLSTRALLTEFDRAYTELKDARGAYRFEDFPRKLVDADIVGNPAEFFFRLDGQIDHILLDEFQDTSIEQWQLLQPLVAEVVSGEGAAGIERTLFCVGDVKQTLYAWRNAEPRLCGTVLEQWPQVARASLVTSYRSSQIVIDAVNDVFGALSANPVLGNDADRPYLAAAAREWAGWFDTHSTVHKDKPGLVRLRTCAAGENKDACDRAAMALAVDLVVQRRQENPTEEIAILLRRKKHLARLIELLRRQGISAAGEGGSPLSDDAAVCTALALLHLLDHPDDTAAAYHVAHSPLGEALGIRDGMPPTEICRVTQTLRMQLYDLGLGRLLATWLGPIARGCDPRNFRRCQQLIEMAHGFTGGDIAAFIQSVRAQRIEDTFTSPVRVMTIHQSKGRQFDTVILPDLDGRFCVHPPSLLTRRPSVAAPLDCVTRAVSEDVARLDDTLREMYYAERQRDIVEELCGLYVAMTRAKSRLEMIVHPQQPNKDGGGKLPLSMAGVLRGALVGSQCAAAANKVLWEKAAGTFPTPTPATPETIESGKPQEIRFALGGAWQNRPTVSPSSLEGRGLVDLRHGLTFRDAPALDRGTLLHRWFALIEWLDDGLPDAAVLRRHAEGLDLSPADVAAALEQFQRMCAAPAIRDLLTRPAGEVQVWRERKFAVHQAIAGVRATVAGQLDRAVILQRHGRPVSANLIDYKSDQVSADTIAGRVEHYRPQIHAYRAAVAALLGLAEADIAARLVFLGPGIVCDVP